MLRVTCSSFVPSVNGSMRLCLYASAYLRVQVWNANMDYLSRAKPLFSLTILYSPGMRLCHCVQQFPSQWIAPPINSKPLKTIKNIAAASYPNTDLYRVKTFPGAVKRSIRDFVANSGANSTQSHAGPDSKGRGVRGGEISTRILQDLYYQISWWAYLPDFCNLQTNLTNMQHRRSPTQC